MNKKGFTLMEVLVVVAVMTAVVVLAMVNINKTRSQARDKVRVAHIQEIRLAIEQYRTACGEYPAQLVADTINGCPPGVTLGDFLSEVPDNPDYSETPHVYQNGVYDVNNTYNGYLYAGLTSSLGGKCFEYHLAVPLESTRESDGYSSNEFFSEDHDCAAVSLASEPYNRTCATSASDFSNADADTDYGLYDLRSANNC